MTERARALCTNATGKAPAQFSHHANGERGERQKQVPHAWCPQRADTRVRDDSFVGSRRAESVVVATWCGGNARRGAGLVRRVADAQIVSALIKRLGAVPVN